MVYFDVLGYIFISYNELIGQILHIAIPILSVMLSYYFVHTKGISRGQVFREFLIGLVVTVVASFVSSLFVCYWIAQMLDYFGKTMSWYNLTFFSIGLYCFPTLAIASIFNILFRLKSASHAQARLNGVNACWAFASIIITVMGYRSGYVLMVPVLVFLVVSTIIGLTKSQHSCNLIYHKCP